jgi:hypothetical protein
MSVSLDTASKNYLNHLMACNGCFAQSGKHCEVGKELHLASKPSLDIKHSKNPATPILNNDPRRELYSHLMTCNNCQPEHHQFCDEIQSVAVRYDAWLAIERSLNEVEEVKTAFVSAVVSGRIRRFIQSENA